MRWVSFLLIVLIVASATTPCADSDSCVEESSSVFTMADHDYEEPTGDHCSPFCPCACCGTVVQFAISTVDKENNNLVVTMQSRYHSLNLSEIGSSFWQPPKIS